jgi:hypothetical protein
LKVAAVWGAQILLYPVYMLVQAGLSVGRQLSSAAQAGLPQLNTSNQSQQHETPPTADTPIQRVLSVVQGLEFQVDKLSEALKVGGLKVETLEDNRLVFTASNVELSKLQPSTPSNLQPSTPSNLQPSTPSNLQPSTPSNLQPATPTDLSKAAQELSDERWVIQGVASLLATRTLVLVTVQNQILDILTPQQQQKLSSRISWEVADLLRQRRLAQASEHQIQRRLATLDQHPVWLPARLFWQVMEWVQTSPVAIAANLFQESTLVYRPELEVSRLRLQPSNLQPPNLQPPNLQALTPIQRVLAFLDNTVAELESNQLIPGSEVVLALRDSLRERFASQVAQPLQERTQKRLQQLPTTSVTSESPDASPETSQTNTFGIQALIYAAIDYFFGRGSSNQPVTGSQERSAIPANPQGKTHQLLGRHFTSLPQVGLPSNPELADAVEPDPWLTWSDLFGNPETQELARNPNSPLARGGQGGALEESQIPNPKSQSQLPEAFSSKTPVRPGNSVWDGLKRYLSFKKTPGKLAVPSTGESRVEPSELVVQTAKRKTQTRDRSTALTKLKPSSSSVVGSPSKNVSPATAETTAITTPSSPSPDASLEPAPDWIETQATPSGYVKHPLEQLLGLVDLGMFWVEELMVKVWRWVKQLGRRG